MSAVTNAQFMDAHAAPGYVGLVGGSDWLNRAIRRMQHPGFRPEQRSAWSHAFIFSGRRADGHLWILESDLEMHRKQIRLGVQENRASKYFDAEAFPNLAILDFGLSEQQTAQVLTAALDLLAGLTRYSLREIVGTLLAVQSRRLRRRGRKGTPRVAHVTARLTTLGPHTPKSVRNPLLPGSFCHTPSLILHGWQC